MIRFTIDANYSLDFLRRDLDKVQPTGKYTIQPNGPAGGNTEVRFADLTVREMAKLKAWMKEHKIQSTTPPDPLPHHRCQGKVPTTRLLLFTLLSRVEKIG